MQSAVAQELGYFFEPFDSPQAVGYRALAINIVSVPTELHFDPERVDLSIFAQDDSVRHLAIEHPWHGPTRYRVAIGHIILRDRKHKVVEGFTCGGELTITRFVEHTHCRITSPAPIFPLVSSLGNDPANYNTILANELETLLARGRVRWGHDDVRYEAQLAQLDPLLFYASGLQAVAEQLQAVPSKSRGERYYRLLRTIHRAQQAPQLAGLNLATLPAFDTLV